MGKLSANKSNRNNNKSTNANVNNNQYYNLLFLGPTGVGKSTFINAFVNYLMYDTLEKAKNAQPIVLINSKFVVTDENLVEKVISTSARINISNESDVLGDSATQETKIYSFPILGKKQVLRLIDTPGIGDTRGIDQDELNCDDILHKISQYDEIHAICILLKPDDARITAQFEFCVKQLLSRLDKSATNNIIFIFTNSRASLYRPGDTLPALERLLQNIREQPPHVDIPLRKENTFCMDNEAFRFLMAMREVKFDDEAVSDVEKSWNVSREVCLRLLKYIMGDDSTPGLKPHTTKSTISINEARRLIMQLAQPLTDISQLICDKVYALDQQMKKLNAENQTLSDLKKNMFIPIIDIRVTYFPDPRTVCADLKCTATYMVQGKKKCHYAQRCHNPCFLKNIPLEIIGSSELLHCAAMDGTKCKNCGCDYGKHMHVRYETTLYETEIKDDSITSEITNREAAIKKAEVLVEQMECLKKEYEEEHDIILNSLATFAWFLKNNAITAYNDAYRTYIGYLIDREKSNGNEADQFTINHLQTVLNRYEEYKKILDGAKANSEATINAATITDHTHRLFNLKHCGIKIKKLYEGQNEAHTDKRKSFEYVHPTTLNLNTATSAPQINGKNAEKLQDSGRKQKNKPKNTSPQKAQKQTQLKNDETQKKRRRKRRRGRKNKQLSDQSKLQVQQPPSLQFQPVFHVQPLPPLLLVPLPQSLALPPKHIQPAPPHVKPSPPQFKPASSHVQPPPFHFQPLPQPPQTSYWQPQIQIYKNNYQNRFPMHCSETPNYQSCPQGVPFNFLPKDNQHSCSLDINDEHRIASSLTSPNQQQIQQQYRRTGPSKEMSVNEVCGPSEKSTVDIPTGVYKPKPKQNAERNTTAKSLEQQFSFMKVHEPVDKASTTSNTNKKKIRGRRHENVKKRERNDGNSETPILNANKPKTKRVRQRKPKTQENYCRSQLKSSNTNQSYDAKYNNAINGSIAAHDLVDRLQSSPQQRINEAGTSNANKNNIKRSRNRNFKNRKGPNCNSQLQERNSYKNDADDDHVGISDSEGLIEAQGFVEIRKTELTQQTSAVALAEPHTLSSSKQENHKDGSCQRSETESKTKKAISFLKKLFR